MVETISVRQADHLAISFADTDLNSIEISRDGDTLTLTDPSGASVRIHGLINISELSIVGANQDGQATMATLSLVWDWIYSSKFRMITTDFADRIPADIRQDLRCSGLIYALYRGDF